MLEKRFDADMLYSKIVHHYIDKKRFAKDKANDIAQIVVRREAQRRLCKNGDCGHFMHDHMRNSDTCLISDCACGQFR